MKKGWKSESINYYGGYNGSYKLYEVTSPSGNVYKLHNHSNKSPDFYMETNSPGYYDEHVGKTFNEAVQKLYELEEKKIFHSVGEDYKKQLYEHSFSLKEGYEVEKLDMDTIFFEQVELLKPYKKDSRKYCVYTTNSTKEMQQAKEILKDLFENNYKHTLKRQLEKAKESYEKFESMVDSMMSNDDVFSKKDEKEEDDDYER